MARQLEKRDWLLCGNVLITDLGGAWVGKQFDWLMDPEGP